MTQAPNFRRFAPEPRLAFGSAGGASTSVLLGDVLLAPRSTGCVFGGEARRCLPYLRANGGGHDLEAFG